MTHHRGRVPIPLSRRWERHQRQGRAGSRWRLLGVTVGSTALTLLLLSTVVNVSACNTGHHGSVLRRGGRLAFYRRGAFLLHPLPIAPPSAACGRREREKGREWFLQSVAVRFGGARPCAGCSLASPLRAAGNPPAHRRRDQAEKNERFESLSFLGKLLSPVSTLAALPRLHETIRRGGVKEERSVTLQSGARQGLHPRHVPESASATCTLD